MGNEADIGIGGEGLFDGVYGAGTAKVEDSLSLRKDDSFTKMDQGNDFYIISFRFFDEVDSHIGSLTY